VCWRQVKISVILLRSGTIARRTRSKTPGSPSRSVASPLHAPAASAEAGGYYYLGGHGKLSGIASPTSRSLHKDDQFKILIDPVEAVVGDVLMSETPNPTWMIEVLKDLRAFAAHNGYDASAAALEGAEYQVSLEIEQRRKADGGFPELGDNFTVISRDH
jgi:hypothetical protein